MFTRVARTIGLLLAVATVHRHGLVWWWDSLARGEAGDHAMVLAGLVVVGLWSSRSRWGPEGLGLQARGRWPAVWVVGSTVVSWVSGEPGPVAAVCAVAALYGTAGLFVSPARWAAARPAALLVGLAVPSFPFLQAYVGFPLRLATSRFVSWALSALDVTHVGAGTVLLLDGSAAYVDLPCSGVASLWTSTLFLVGLTLIERRRLGTRWLAVAGVVWTAVAAANAVRVLLIVVLHEVVSWPVVAEIVHAPVGVIGFLICCSLGLAGVRRLPVLEVRPSPPRTGPDLGLAVLAVVLFVGMLPPVLQGTTDPTSLPVPPGTTALTPTEAELALASQRGGRIAKARLDQGSLSGSVVLVESVAWRAQHRPDLCLRAGGATVGADRAIRIAGGRVRLADVQTPDGPARALWWFQSAERTTDDRTERLWASVLDDDPWMMVSVVLDGRPDVDGPDVDALVHELRRHAASNLRSS